MKHTLLFHTVLAYLFFTFTPLLEAHSTSSYFNSAKQTISQKVDKSIAKFKKWHKSSLSKKLKSACKTGIVITLLYYGGIGVDHARAGIGRKMPGENATKAFLIATRPIDAAAYVAKTPGKMVIESYHLICTIAQSAKKSLFK